MSKSSTLKAVVVLILVGLVTYSAWDSGQETAELKARLLTVTYQTNATRTNNVKKYCSAGVSRSQLASSD